jgi:hypothetical protein
VPYHQGLYQYRKRRGPACWLDPGTTIQVAAKFTYYPAAWFLHSGYTQLFLSERLINNSAGIFQALTAFSNMIVFPNPILAVNASIAYPPFRYELVCCYDVPYHRCYDYRAENRKIKYPRGDFS